MGKAGKFAAAVVLLIVVGLVPACARSAPQTTVPTPPAPLAPGAGREYAVVSKADTATGEAGATDRKIVKTGYITLEVNDITTTMEEVARLAQALGGYVVSSSKQGEDAQNGNISIRVPADRFDEASAKLRQLALKVPFESTESRDVTEEYTDLKAQLHNLEATEAQYLELLKKAQTVEDILKVYRELTSVRGEIERVKGRIQYLERTSDMALIQVNLQRTQPIGGKEWSALQTLKSAARGLITAGKVLADIIIWLIVFSPLWGVVLGIVLWLMRRRARRTASQG